MLGKVTFFQILFKLTILYFLMCIDLSERITCITYDKLFKIYSTSSYLIHKTAPLIILNVKNKYHTFLRG